jgi:ABC-type transport system substrate-binding protein
MGEVYNKKSAFTSWWVRSPSDIIIHQATVKGAAWNESQFSDPTYDALIAESRTTTDPRRQSEAYAQALRILAHKSGWMIPFWFDRVFPAKKRLQDVGLDPVNNVEFLHSFLI